MTSVRLTNGRRVQIYLWGEGPCLLFVHGWAGRGTQFRKFIEFAVEHGYQAAAIDGPAHGRSDGSKTNLLEFAEAIQISVGVLKPAAIVAHSFGGVASLYAAVHGLPVKIIICIASPSIGDEIINTYLRAVRGSQKTGDAIREYVLRTMNEPFDAFTSSHFMKNFSAPFATACAGRRRRRRDSSARACLEGSLPGSRINSHAGSWPYPHIERPGSDSPLCNIYRGTRVGLRSAGCAINTDSPPLTKGNRAKAVSSTYF
ncbi:MAG: alpha/beta hydrolase [Bacteroidia bacterium]|nr:alpha/beta hydrolase [Bacteroidia bacterium]